VELGDVRPIDAPRLEGGRSVEAAGGPLNGTLLRGRTAVRRPCSFAKCVYSAAPK